MKKLLDIVDIGHSAYAPALALQEKIVADRKAGKAHDTLILVEHDPVYTLGRNAVQANVLWNANELAERNIDVVHTGRGGDVTFHGPGQLVGYPIVKLAPPDEGVLWYVNKLEDVLMKVLADFGIEGGRNSANRGVWVGNAKIAAIGVRVTGQVTLHGFALNVTTDLAYYAGIVPCGLPDKGVISMQVLDQNVRMEAVKASVVDHFRREFNYVAGAEAHGRFDGAGHGH